jgi:hypothetical protein
MPSVSVAAANVKQAAIGLKKIREKNKIAKKHLPGFREFFETQRDLLLEQLSTLKPILEEQPSIAKTNKTSEQLRAELLKEFNAIWSDVEKATTTDLQDLVVSAEMDGMQKGGDMAAKMLPFDPSKKPGTTFNLENPRAVAWFKKNGGSLSKIKDIQTTTADSLKTVITTALDEGWSYNQTAKEIRKLYDGPISRDRAQTIAVYESAQAYEAGNRGFVDGLTDDGVTMEKRYQTSEDPLVSELCQGNQDDGWIPLDQPHTSGVQNPPGHVRCRCYEIYREASRSE